MTLTEFLLARIAEDEAGAKALDSIGYHPESANLPSVQQVEARVLAECEAKRRIVERTIDDMALYRHVFNEIRPVDAEDYTSGALWGLGFVMRLLAVPYADHPDYLPEWAPEK